MSLGKIEIFKILWDFDKVLPKKVGVLDENNFSGGTALFSGV